MIRRTLIAAAAAVGIGAAALGTAATPADAKVYLHFGFPGFYPGYYYAPPPVYYVPRYGYRTRCWRKRRGWRRVWNGYRWVKRRRYVRVCRRVYY